MNAPVVLPEWLQYAQAIGAVATPILAAIVASLAAWIALQQMRIARMKLDHDRYEKRVAVFEAARKLLAEAVTTDSISRETFREFVVGTSVAPFHFGNEVVQYLDQIRRTAGSLMVNQRAANERADTEDGARAKNEAEKQLLWLQNELQDGYLINRFRGYLALTSKS
jgi:hypothetical protein